MFKKFDSRQWLKIVLQLTFAGMLVTANFMASKLIAYPIPFAGEIVGSVAAIAIGINFFCTDLLSEIYGEREAREAVNGTVFALVIVYLFAWLAVSVPPAESYAANNEFVTVFSSSYPIIVGSILSIIVSQNLDISIFHALKRATHGRHKWVRNIGSTVVSQGLDTAFFTIMAFVVLPPLFGGEALPLGIAGSIILAEYIVKIVVALVDTPFFYLISGVAEKVRLDTPPEVAD